MRQDIDMYFRGFFFSERAHALTLLPALSLASLPPRGGRAPWGGYLGEVAGNDALTNGYSGPARICGVDSSADTL